MFDFFKRKKKSPENAQPADPQAPQQVEDNNDVAEASEATNLVPEAPLVQAETPVSETEEILQQAAEPVPEPVTETVPEQAEPQKKEAPSEPEIKTEVSASQIAADDLAAEPEDVVDPDVMVPVPEKAKDEKKGFFGRISAGLSKTRSNLTDGLSTLLLGKKEIDDDMMEDLETQLIMADVGVEATTEIIDRLTKRVGRKELRDSDALYEALIEELQDMLAVSQKPLVIDSSKKPYVILMVGINGVGKTTTIGKLAKQFQARGKSVMLAAGDTFRAAAVEQLQVWGERNNVPVVAQHTGADSASVLFDAVQAATSRGVDILIADTAGRLHNKDNLMQELEKVVRVMKKIDDTAPHEVMLVLDAGTGQNAINQTKTFLQSVGVTGLTLTKLDGTAKGGIIFALAKQFGLPVRYIGVGEKIEDLRPFNADDFTRALFRIGDD
ncbi:MAG: signal recognition particle-docking protein FtsY [Oceanospirillaceae bacterium]|jgi:fused signal recognition particle receptor|uniref:signal recognition particle-docking protein FtsY n=1 Tax=unclassified Thalassolituus TaxID=2624967 RepID=UPI000B66DAF4|nr:MULTISPECIES: signal recognition particle-docking protein FtsY [unclassified Thalassolituus]MAE34159.1 signal recognition particle-docking protein FtsY [Oceanospirillaceae bacterium]OUX67603.1 MAG: signal recognition particle-docking protein FtsY [Oceanospirillaceae bacterium TMED276]MBN58107.1 signal recognition particle-docking protein FtsY [Oceanospirillaceae bacterium]MDQ4424566.1 signal recognition particle-docking protein FtsY [Thalassolituus sp.]MDQ4426529.1 signal recognition partic|tara:strand:+ start:87 stop:1406 length:1320 start_codon:yes stop_codon:yes gene_type:complete